LPDASRARPAGAKATPAAFDEVPAVNKFIGLKTWTAAAPVAKEAAFGPYRTTLRFPLSETHKFPAESTTIPEGWKSLTSETAPVLQAVVVACPKIKVALGLFDSVDADGNNITLDEVTSESATQRLSFESTKMAPTLAKDWTVQVPATEVEKSTCPITASAA